MATEQNENFKINNLNDEDMAVIVPWLSRDRVMRYEQIKFINGNAPINQSIASTYIDPEEVAKSVKDLGKINSLTKTTAKFTIKANGYFDEGTDMLGSSILNSMDTLVNWAETGVNSMERGLNSLNEKVANAREKYIDRTLAPCTGWADKKLQSVSAGLSEDIDSFNKKLKSSRALNVPGDVFNSMRHIAFAIKGDLQKLVDFAHQIFAGMTAAILKLKKLVAKAIKALTVFAVNLIQNLIPTGVLQSISQAVNGVLLSLGETVGTFLNTAGLDTTTNLFAGLTDEITSFATAPLTYVFGQLDVQTFINIPALNNINSFEKKLLDPLNNAIKFADSLSIDNLVKQLSPQTQKFLYYVNQIANNAHGFIGNGVRNYAKKKLLKGKSSTTLGKLNKFGIKFSLSQSYHYNTAKAYNTVPYITFKKLMTDQPDIMVDSYGNKFNYFDYTRTHLF